MIRDPSDGSVRETSDIGIPTSKPITGLKPVIASGLPLESTKPDRTERLDKSREQLRNYRETGLWTTATDASSPAIAGDQRAENDE